MQDKLEQLQNLLRHQVPNRDIAVILERAADLLLEKTLKERFAQNTPRRRLVVPPSKSGVARSQLTRPMAHSQRTAAARPSEPPGAIDSQLTESTADCERIEATNPSEPTSSQLAAPTVESERIGVTKTSEPTGVDSSQLTASTTDSERAEANPSEPSESAGVISSQLTASSPVSQRTDETKPRMTSSERSTQAHSRYVPRAVVREVYERDGGQCTFVSSNGRRCAARGFLELHHHETPYARGGAATAANLRTVCRAHNGLFADRDFGRAFMQSKRQARRSASAKT